MPRDPNALNSDKSVWANKFFPVTDLRQNREQWVRDWDKGIVKACSIEPEENFHGAIFIFVVEACALFMSKLRRKKLDRHDYQRLREVRTQCEQMHESVMAVLRAGSDKRISRSDHLEWFALVSPETRRDIVCEGFEQACWQSWCGQDGRMLCPELNSAELLKRRGQNLFDLYERCRRVSEEGGAEKFDSVIVRTEWWKSALGDGMVLQSTTPEINKWAYEYVTCIRTQYILDFLMRSYYALCLKCEDTQNQANDNIVATRILRNIGPEESLRIMMSKWSNHRSALPCENCRRRPDDVGTKFMSCSSCKRKLDFDVRYCSRECQKANWPAHKIHCGKEKISRNREEWCPEYNFSVALQLQVKMQCDFREVDYVLFRRQISPMGHKVAYDNSEKRNVFRDALKLLWTAADKEGIDIVAKCLVDAVDADESVQSGITRDDVIQQLVDEYEVDVRSALEKLEAKLVMEDDEERYNGMLIDHLVDPEELARLLAERQAQEREIDLEAIRKDYMKHVK